MSTPRESDLWRESAGASQTVAHPNTKKYARRYGTTGRTAQRHRKAEDAKGSPMYNMLRAVDAAEDPWILVAHLQLAAERRNLKDRPLYELVSRYRELLAADSLHEGKDNALKVCRETSWVDRANCSAQDAAHDLEKAALEQEFMVRRVPLDEVFG